MATMNYLSIRPAKRFGSWRVRVLTRRYIHLIGIWLPIEVSYIGKFDTPELAYAYAKTVFLPE